MEKIFVEVIIPVPLDNTYTYSIPSTIRENIVPGCLVLVEFGKNKHYSAIISYVHTIPIESNFEIKEILAVESPHPILRRPQIRFWEWISEYYLCKLGEVYKTVLPSGFRSENSSAYKSKKETFVRLTSIYSEYRENLYIAFEKTKRAEKQERLLLAYIEYSQIFVEGKSQDISKRVLLEKSQSKETALTALIDKNILETYEKNISRLDFSDIILSEINPLSQIQQQAYGEIVRSFREKDVCLLHGVTAAGKTEIYVHLINETLKLGRQALFLLPEIALTAQINQRLKKVFGNKLGIYHSKVSDNERVEIWNNLLLDQGYQVILGARSSIFLPFRDLGLIVVDEEHEPGYKQQDPAPRYHARNSAIVLANMHGAKVILGSATPSLESYHNAQIGKYAYVKLDKRFENIDLPEIIPVDIKELRRKKRMKSLFSPLLIEKMQQTLNEGNQVILFQNRRGFSPMIFCKICDWVPKCKFCDVSLSYHKRNNRLVCHYCGNTCETPVECQECGNPDLRPRGFGTEKVEEEIKEIFPEVFMVRMDSDTTRNKDSHEKIIRSFESGKAQLLIGTQMVSKGLDFGKVSLVGILNADSMMNFPDFRAHERAFQLMAQVAGRAGRRKTRGEVVLQTSHPEHPIIQYILNNDYEGMSQLQLEERALFKYPPFFRIVEITFKHKQQATVEKLAKEYAGHLRLSLGNRILGPDRPPVSKIKNFHLQKLILKIEVTASLVKFREILENTQTHISANAEFKYAVIQFDVDPV